MAKLVESEVVSKQFFKSLGFNVLERDFKGLKKGCDFFIEDEGCIQSVEAKAKMGNWIQMLKPQVDRIKNSGLIAIVDRGKVEIKTIDDLEKIEERTVYRITFKKKE